MEVVILAAGMGERLMPLTRNTPKSLLDIGGGYTLLEHQLQVIAEAGIDSVRIVAGYRAEQIEAKVRFLTGVDVEIVYNPFYRTTNNLCSAWFGLRGRSAPVVLVNGDDVFTAQVIRDLVAASGDAVAVVSTKEKYDEDDMKVTLDESGRITRFGKDIALTEADGEAIGITMLSSRGLKELQEVLERKMRDESGFGQFYLAAYQQMIVDGVRFEPVFCTQDDWAEVDFHPDVEVVRRTALAHLKTIHGETQ